MKEDRRSEAAAALKSAATAVVDAVAASEASPRAEAETAAEKVSESTERRIRRFNGVLSVAQGAGLLAIAFAALVGIGQSIWEIFSAGSAEIGSLLMIFLYIEILSMVKGARLGTRELPIHTPVALAIVAVARYLVVDIEHITPTLMLYASGAILVLVIGLKIVSTIPQRDRN